MSENIADTVRYVYGGNDVRLTQDEYAALSARATTAEQALAALREATGCSECLAALRKERELLTAERDRLALQLQTENGGPLVEQIALLRAERDQLAARLTIEQPHPFGEGYDAIDLLNDRVAALEAERDRLAGVLASGVGLIAAERQRQQAEEGWTPEHDAQWTHDELPLAAACYAFPNLAPELWPFAGEWWKPTPDNRIRELTKAGALIAAEIDRLARTAPTESEGK